MDYTAVAILACIFIPLERLIPLHPEQRTLRRDWVNDLLYVLLNGFVVRAGFTALAGAIIVAGPPQGGRAGGTVLTIRRAASSPTIKAAPGQRRQSQSRSRPKAPLFPDPAREGWRRGCRD